jgi:glycine hydroxymethyltransferase
MTHLRQLSELGFDRLASDDPTLFDLLSREQLRQARTLSMVASSSVADPSVLVCEGSSLSNVTTEGYPGRRYHAGCEIVDQVENIAVERAKAAFGARYANVQPHSGSSANQVVMFGLLSPGDRILGLDLDSGGHLTHGARVNVSGQYFDAIGYKLDEQGLIDYAQVRELALKHRPRLIISGASAYPRTINFARFREIADEAGALLLADISHISGLVAAGCHPSPIDHAHITTTSTYKQLYGPRGGLILCGRDADMRLPNQKRSLAETMQYALFPAVQGTPNLGAVAAKARAFALVASPAFKDLARLIVADARALAACLVNKGYRVLTGGTDNHIVVIDVGARGLTGRVAEAALEECGLIVNKNRIPHDTRSALVASGVRFGTNTLALRGMGPDAMASCVELVERVLSSVHMLSDTSYRLAPANARFVRDEVEKLCARYPLPHYPQPREAAAHDPAARPNTVRHGMSNADAWPA